MGGIVGSTADILRLIKVSHTLFALPFALSSFFLASGFESFPWTVFVWVLFAMFSMRSAAMCFNRFLDADIDAQNPRTANREIPQGVLSRKKVFLYTIFFSLLFFLSCAQINLLALQLSPLAWAVSLGYSFCKRFTSLSHFVLGLALGLSPVGAWIAVTGEFSLIPILMGGVVLLWTAGFDILYACMDYEFDKKVGLHSIPAKIGIQNSLRVARLLHVLMMGVWVLMILQGGYGWALWATLAVATALVGLEHVLVKPGDWKRMNLVFFKLNVFVSVCMLVGCTLEVTL